MEEDKVDIELLLDTKTLELIQDAVEIGYLGTTISAVVEHILRQYLWETRK